MTEHIQSYRRNSDLSATLRVLADDRDRISAGRTDADLARAPILFDWEPKAKLGARACHPRRPDRMGCEMRIARRRSNQRARAPS